MILVIDASVASKWFLRFRPDEADVARALALLEQAVSDEVEVFQPPHFFAEMAAVLGREKADAAQADLDDLLQLDFHVVENPELYALALELSIRLQHHLFDTLYHAVALQHPGAVFITADRRYFDKARSEGRIHLLASLPEAFPQG